MTALRRAAERWGFAEVIADPGPVTHFFSWLPDGGIICYRDPGDLSQFQFAPVPKSPPLGVVEAAQNFLTGGLIPAGSVVTIDLGGSTPNRVPLGPAPSSAAAGPPLGKAGRDAPSDWDEGA